MRNDSDLAARVARLTAGQRACLDLVDDHATSKEIALRLGISRHTVDARLRQAMQTLGVASRREAAIIWRAAQAAGEAAGEAEQGYQPFAYQPSRIVERPDEGKEGTADAEAECDGNEDGISEDRAYGALGALPRPVRQVADAAVWTWESAPRPTPGLRLWGGANDLTAPQRLVGILIVTILAMLAFGLLLSGIAALTQLRT
ncbi:MAG: helix-turn-helix transcriptional regulator [Sphingomonadaceae bacterium]